MVIRAEAQSLDTLTRLADDPPLHIRRYPAQPPPSHHGPHTPSQNQLKLYIVRVPNSQDIILTPLKPQCNTVTAQDIISCLYYLRVQPLEPAPKPRSQSLQPEHTRGTSSLDDARPSYPRASFSGESSRSEHLAPGGHGNGFLSPSTSSLTSMNSMHSSHVACGNDFEITFIRRDPTTGTQTTVGRIYSNNNSPLESMTHMPNSFAAQMMAQEAMISKKGRRDRKRLNLEIWTPGYQKFLCQRPVKRPAAAAANLEAPDSARPSTGTSDGGSERGSEREGFRGYLWPAPVPPPPPGLEDVGPPPPPKDPARPPPSAAMRAMNPAMARINYQSRFTEIYSPDTPVAPPVSDRQDTDEMSLLQEYDEDSDGIFKRTLHLAGESFWKNTGKRISAFHSAHLRKRSYEGSSGLQQQQNSGYTVDEEARLAMQQMGLYSPQTASPSSCPPSGTPTGADDLNNSRKETKGKGYIFAPPHRGTGNCEFETNSVGRKIRLRLIPSVTMTGSPYGQHTSLVKSDPITLCTLSFQPPDTIPGDRTPGMTPSSSSSYSGHSRSASASAKFKLVGEKFKAKLNQHHHKDGNMGMQRQGSWTEVVEHEAGSGLKSKLGSLLVEGEGMDVLDMVVISSMGVFWKRYCEWSEDLREGGFT
ncbi:hypothetical protein ABW20_dc0100468 [Dactylellina cionopaga]|nr:hypothetical protein ABW20_dc0100468 [Dactylellina cionopaga]